MSAGAAVLTSDVSSLPEVGGDAVRYVDPRDIAAIAEGLRSLLEDGELRADLGRRSSRRAAQFTWTTFARTTLTALEQAAAGTDGDPGPSPGLAAAPAGHSDRRLPPRVGLNAVFLMPGMGGLDTYVQDLVPEMVRLAPEVRFTIYCSDVGKRHLQSLSWADEVQLVTHPLLGRRGLKAASELTLLGALAGRQVDLLHNVGLTAPWHTRAVNVVTIADVTWMLGPATPPTTRLWRLVVPPVARRADRIIAISDAGAAQIEQFLHVPRARIDVTLLGYTQRGTVAAIPAAEVRERFLLGDGPIVLMVGTRKPHKNLVRLIEALPAVLAVQPDAMLVLCGNATVHEAELRAAAEREHVSARVAFLGFVDDAELEGLYAAAACFVLASTNEGFGLPVLEAMGRGVPVACSNVSALPEVAGDAARLFDPLDVSDISTAILEILTDRRFAERLIAGGRRRASSLTWERTAESTLDCYERAWRARRGK
jgi:glycosyltransferase involved in cell wall biosynthesis